MGIRPLSINECYECLTSPKEEQESTKVIDVTIPKIVPTVAAIPAVLEAKYKTQQLTQATLF
jgi:hypothetical protein